MTEINNSNYAHEPRIPNISEGYETQSVDVDLDANEVVEQYQPGVERDYRDNERSVRRFETVKKVGRISVKLVLPFATEIIQRHNSHQRMAINYRESRSTLAMNTTYDSLKKSFSGSIEDFVEIQHKKKQQKQSTRVS